MAFNIRLLYLLRIVLTESRPEDLIAICRWWFSQLRPLDNCGHDMSGCPTLVFIDLPLPFSQRLISTPYHQTQDPGMISSCLRGEAARVTGEMTLVTGPGRLTVNRRASCPEAGSCSNTHTTVCVPTSTLVAFSFVLPARLFYLLYVFY